MSSALSALDSGCHGAPHPEPTRPGAARPGAARLPVTQPGAASLLAYASRARGVKSNMSSKGNAIKKLITFTSSMLALALLSGCTPAASTAQTAQPTATETTRPTASASPSPTASALPTEQPHATELDCMAAVTQTGHDILAADGLTLRDPEPGRSWDYPILERIATEGVVCKWSTRGDVQVVLGQLAMGEDEWATVRTGLIESGFVEYDFVVPGFLDGPDEIDPDYPRRGVLHRDGTLYYSNYPGFFEFVTAFQA